MDTYHMLLVVLGNLIEMWCTMFDGITLILFCIQIWKLHCNLWPHHYLLQFQTTMSSFFFFFLARRFFGRCLMLLLLYYWWYMMLILLLSYHLLSSLLYMSSLMSILLSFSRAYPRSRYPTPHWFDFGCFSTQPSSLSNKPVRTWGSTTSSGGIIEAFGSRELKPLCGPCYTHPIKKSLAYVCWYIAGPLTKSPSGTKSQFHVLMIFWTNWVARLFFPHWILKSGYHQIRIRQVTNGK